MTNSRDALESAVAFIEGRLAPLDFETELAVNAQLEKFLLELPPIQPYSSPNFSLYHYLIGLNYSDPGDLINAQDAIAKGLLQCDVDVKPSTQQAQFFDLLLSAQPGWLSADTAYLASLLSDAPTDLSHKELRSWLRKRILELFRYTSKPPRWIQSPDWPIGAKGPLVFLGQINLPNYFHDQASVFVFHDPASGECKNIIQVE